MLVVGMSGLGAEVSKNIVLAGVQEVTVMDHAPLETGATANRFLVQQNGVNVMLPPPPSFDCCSHDVVCSPVCQAGSAKTADFEP